MVITSRYQVPNDDDDNNENTFKTAGRFGIFCCDSNIMTIKYDKLKIGYRD